MQGMDTNVIVRYLTGDDPQQADQARAVIGQKPVLCRGPSCWRLL